MVKLMKNEKGLTLIEVIVALGLLGVIIIAFLGAMAGASRAMFVADERATAESIARSEMEYIKNQPYDDTEPQSYDKITPEPVDGYTGYTVKIVAESLNNPDDGIQKITITVYHNGDPVLTSGDYTLEGYKVER